MKKHLFILIMLLTFNTVFSQESEGIPPSPSVASLVTVEKDSVNSTGMIVQKIPLWSMKLGKYSFPIDMIYSSSGIKVEQIPSYVGTGWNLSAGGVITRSVIDLPDDMISSDHGKGILHTNLMNDIKNFEYNITTYGYNETTAKNFIKNKVNENIREGTRNDTQPDIFYFNFFGKQGKFIFNENKKIVSLASDNYKYSYQLASDNTLLSFEITDTQGIIYVFSEREYSETLNVGNKAWEFLISRSLRKKKLDYFSSWHLKSVITPNHRIINLEYDNESVKYKIREAVMGKICQTAQCEDTNITNTDNRDVLNLTNGKGTEYVISSKKIKKISSSNLFEINFNNTMRQDLEGGKKLSCISIQDMFGKEIKKFDFNYSYFISPNMHRSNNYESKRLKLDKINLNNQFYQEFEYYENYALPHRNSTEQDYWGYYNKNGATSLVPKVYMENNQQPYKYHVFKPLNTLYSTYGQINRNVDENYIHMGMLKMIKYQTRGTKKFFYEPNDFTHPTYTNSTIPSLKGNGVRLQKVEYFDGVNTEALNYDYKNPKTGVSSGKVSYLPQFATHIPWNFVYDFYDTDFAIISPNNIYIAKREYFYDHNTNSYHDCLRYNGGKYLNYSPTNQKQKYFAMTTRRFSLSQMPLTHNVENQLSYEHITLKEGNNGKKEYRFNILGAIGNNLPSSFDKNKFKNRKSIRSYNWYLDDTTPLQTGSCYANQVTPLGPGSLEIVKKYINYLDLSGNSHPFSPNPNWNRYFGSLKEFTYLDETGFKVFKKVYDYDVRGGFHHNKYNTNHNSKKIISLKHHVFSRPWGRGWTFDRVYSNGAIMQPSVWIYSFIDTYYGIGLSPTKITRTNYYENESKSITTEFENFYNWGNLLTSTSIIDSKGEKHTIKYKYPKDFAFHEIFFFPSPNISFNTYYEMVLKNVINFPIEITTIRNNKIVSSEINSYSSGLGYLGYNKSQCNILENATIHEDNFSAAQANINGLNIDDRLSERILYDKYDNQGNLEMYHIKDGTFTVLIWGYNKTQIIAKIENIASYGDVEDYIANLQTLSNNDNDRTVDTKNSLGNVIAYNGKEGKLREALQGLRNALPNAQVTTYTYDPLIGVTSMTDPRGETIYYTYDTFNRLEFVKDADGNILTNNQYNYKN